MIDNNKHMSVFGIGPLMVTPVMVTVILIFVFNFYNFIPKYEIISLNWLLMILGFLIIINGAVYWISAVTSSIYHKIKSTILVTTGVYGIVRHPIYAAFLYFATGLILISNNIYLFVLPIVYWVFFSVVLKNTEEKMLISVYGQDYLDYSKNVNRFIPKMVK